MKVKYYKENRKQNKNTFWSYLFLSLIIIVSLIITITFNASFLEKKQIDFVPYLILLLIVSIVFIGIVFSRDVKSKTKDMIKILELFLIIMTVLIASTQMQILNKQTELIKETSQSNKPNIILTTSKDIRYYSYSLQDLDESGREAEKLHIGIINEGKSIAPSVSVKMVSDEFLRKNWETTEGITWEINEMKSLGYNSTSLFFSSNPKYGNLTTGIYNLTFSIECPYCDQSYKEENITICIYSDHTLIEDECKKGWRP